MLVSRIHLRWFAAAVVLLAAGWLGLRAAAQSPSFLPGVQKNYRPDSISDCSAIQQAIDNLPATGGVVLITGSYLCQSPVVIARDQVELRGEGPSATLRLADGANSPLLIIGDTATPPARHHQITLRNLVLDGNRAHQSLECWGGTCDSGGLTFIRNNGLTVRGVEDVLVENLVIFSARSGGLVAEKIVRRLAVRGLEASDNQFDGLAAYQTEDSLFTELFLHDNPFAGLSLDIAFNRNVISAAILADNGKQGIFMRDSRDNLFQGVQIRNSGEMGLFLAQAEGGPATAATGNTFVGLVVSNSAQMGMKVNDASCTNNLVSAAQFINNPAGCILSAVPNLVVQSGVICR